MKKITFFCLLLFAVNIYSQTQLLSVLDEVDIGGGNWVNSSGTNYAYENNNLKIEIDLFWTGTSWEISGKTTYSYNANNKATEEVYQNYNTSSSMYENEDRVVFTYNGNGDLSKIEGYIWDTGVWIIESMSTLAYTGTTLTGGFSEDYDGSTWVNTFQSTLSYMDGNISQIIEEEWNATIVDWELDGRNTFTYDSNDKISSVVYDNRNDVVWEESFTVTYVLDGNGNRTSETETYSGGGSFITTYIYDTSALMSSFDNPFADYNGLEYLYEDHPHVNKVLSSISTSNFRSTYDYNNVLTVNENLYKRPVSLEIFPNPTTDYVTVKSSETIDYITVFNALGSKIISTKDKKISVSHLPKGVYLMYISLANGSALVKKIIKD